MGLVKKLALSLLAVGASFALFGAVANSQALVNSYKAKTAIQPGWVVALVPGATDTVELSPADDSTKIFGVSVDPSQVPVAVQKSGSSVYVGTDGAYPVFVSTEDGTIKQGDYLSISKTDGIAAIAQDSQSFVVGRAIENFDGKTKVLAKDGNGAAIGLIMVQVTVAKNPHLRDNITVPQPLQKIAESVAGKKVSVVRIYISLIVFLLALFIAAVLLWSGIRNGMVAIGRNPLSRHFIMQGLLQVIIAAALVFIAGLFAIYILLKV